MWKTSTCPLSLPEGRGARPTSGISVFRFPTGRHGRPLIPDRVRSRAGWGGRPIRAGTQRTRAALRIGLLADSRPEIWSRCLLYLSVKSLDLGRRPPCICGRKTCPMGGRLKPRVNSSYTRSAASCWARSRRRCWSPPRRRTSTRPPLSAISSRALMAFWWPSPAT